MRGESSGDAAQVAPSGGGGCAIDAGGSGSAGWVLVIAGAIALLARRTR